jgi:hypothetical protein
MQEPEVHIFVSQEEAQFIAASLFMTINEIAYELDEWEDDGAESQETLIRSLSAKFMGITLYEKIRAFAKNTDREWSDNNE